MATEVAAAFDAQLDAFVVRKIGLPGQAEFGVGAVAKGGEPLFDEVVLSRLGLTEQDLVDAVATSAQSSGAGLPVTGAAGHCPSRRAALCCWSMMAWRRE